MSVGGLCLVSLFSDTMHIGIVVDELDMYATKQVSEVATGRTLDLQCTLHVIPTAHYLR